MSSTPSTFNAIEFVASDALKHYLQENLQSVLPVVFSHEMSDLIYPCVFITDGDAAELIEDTATYSINLSVGVATRTGTERSAHIQFVGALMDLIFNDDLMTELNNNRAPGLFVERIEKPLRRTENDGAVRRTTQQLVLMASMSA